LIHLKVVRKLI